MSLYENNPTDPKKTTKTVTKGEPTTTTSTRRGEYRGIPGTFTDTKVDTPVTTDTTGSKEFNSAFANARKSGSSTFDFGGKSYSTEVSDSKKTNESSMTSTFKRDKVQGVPQVNAAGIKFSPQSYKMGKTQDIQEPGAMGAYSVSRGDGRDASIGKLKTQEPMALNEKQGAGLRDAGDRINQQLESRFGRDRIEQKFSGRSEEFINKKVKEGQTRIANNKVTVKREQ